MLKFNQDIYLTLDFSHIDTFQLLNPSSNHKYHFTMNFSYKDNFPLTDAPNLIKRNLIKNQIKSIVQRKKRLCLTNYSFEFLFVKATAPNYYIILLRTLRARAVLQSNYLSLHELRILGGAFCFKIFKYFLLLRMLL